MPEEVASGLGMVRRYRGAAPRRVVERAEDVLAAADAGDDVAQRIVDEGGRMLGSIVAGLVNVLDPEAVVIGGGLGLARRALPRAVQDLVRRAHLGADQPDDPDPRAALGRRRRADRRRARRGCIADTGAEPAGESAADGRRRTRSRSRSSGPATSRHRDYLPEFHRIADVREIVAVCGRGEERARATGE